MADLPKWEDTEEITTAEAVPSWDDTEEVSAAPVVKEAVRLELH